MELEQQYRENMSLEEDKLMDLCNLPLVEKGLDLSQLKEIIQWKSPRSVHWVPSDQEPYICEITRFALSAHSERARIEALTLLDGVSWPTASVILHFCHADPYPILDFRALWSVQTDLPPSYNFEFWERYMKFCRGEAENLGMSMRVFDRALWQYSKINQPVDKIKKL
jgi:hypothetical protein